MAEPIYVPITDYTPWKRIGLTLLLLPGTGARFRAVDIGIRIPFGWWAESET